MPQSGADIGREMGIQRQQVSNTLKRAMKKVYLNIGLNNPLLTPFQIATAMATAFDLEDSEYGKFFNLFPPDLRNKIKESAAEFMEQEASKRSSLDLWDLHLPPKN